MTKKTLLTTLLASAVGLTAAVAAAQPGPGGPDGAAMRDAQLEKRFAQWDQNGDGAVTLAEIRAFHAAKRAAVLAEFDTNGDGTLDRTERKAVRHAKMVERFEAIDTDGNAEISRAEAEAAHPGVARHFDRGDRDGNGVISWDEFEQGAKHMHKMRKRMKRKFRNKGVNPAGEGRSFQRVPAPADTSRQ